VQKFQHLLQGRLGQRIWSKIKAQIHQKRWIEFLHRRR
jgi:hypothetical protein